MARVALTTIDNPWNPFTNFEEWWKFDHDMGYDCCGYLGRESYITDQLSDEEEDAEVERAIDDIIKFDFTNMYRKVKENEDKKT